MIRCTFVCSPTNWSLVEAWDCNPETIGNRSWQEIWLALAGRGSPGYGALSLEMADPKSRKELLSKLPDWAIKAIGKVERWAEDELKILDGLWKHLF